jgi:hypothetical protein
MTIISNFTQSFQSDPAFRKKSLALGIGILIASILAIGFLWLNFSSGQSTQKKAATKDTKSTETKPVSKPEVPITATSLDSNPNFKKVAKEPISFPDDVLVSNNDNFFINDKFYFTANDKSVITPSLYTQSQMVSGPDGVVINEANSSSIYTKEQKIKGFPDKVIQVTPVVDSITKSSAYYFIDLSTKPISVAKATKLDLSDKTLVSNIDFSKDKFYESLELRQLGKNVYLFGFEKSTRAGKIDMYLVESNKTTLQKQLADIVSFKYSKNHVIYNTYTTVSNKPLLKVTVVDFNTPKLDIYNVDILDNLNRDRVYGGFLANRCSIGENSDSMYCLIKKSFKPEDTATEPDVIAKIEWKVNKVSYILRDESFSASHIYAVNDKSVYFVSQIGNYLYKLNNVDSQ